MQPGCSDDKFCTIFIFPPEPPMTVVNLSTLLIKMHGSGHKDRFHWISKQNYMIRAKKTTTKKPTTSYAAGADPGGYVHPPILYS